MSIPIPEKRVAEFENFGFGMFVHWGRYSIIGIGEGAHRICRCGNRIKARAVTKIVTALKLLT